MPHECTNCSETFADGSKEMLSGCPSCGGNKFQFRPSSSSESPESATSAKSAASTDSTASTETSGDGAPGATGDPTNRGRSPATTESASAGSRRAWPGQETSGDTESSSPKPWPSTAREPANRRQSTAAAESDVTVDPQRPASTSTRRGRSQPSDVSSSDGGPAAETREDRAQADARSGTVSPDEISRAAPAETPQSAGDTDDTAEVDDKPDLSTLREELNEQFESIKIVSPGQYELNLMELYDRDSYIISLQEDGHYVIEVPETWNRDDD